MFFEAAVYGNFYTALDNSYKLINVPQLPKAELPDLASKYTLSR
jgi:hypothetical protein